MKTILLYFFLALICLSCGNSSDSAINSLSLNSKILSKRNSDIGCFGEIIYEQGNKVDTLKRVCYCVVEEQKLFDYVQTGDSLIKENGTFEIFVIRDKVKKRFIYPTCRQ